MLLMFLYKWDFVMSLNSTFQNKVAFDQHNGVIFKAIILKIVLFFPNLIFLIRFSKLSLFNRPSLPVDMEGFMQKAPIENL